MFYETERFMKEASKVKDNLFEVFKTEWSDMKTLMAYLEQDGIEKVICHNDINADNCLLTDNSFDIRDWEFAGWNDPAFDFGRIIAEYDFESTEIDEILEAYFGRSATAIERLHWIAYIAVHSWYYIGWGMYKESIQEETKDWIMFFYKKLKSVLKYVLPRYENIYGKI